MRECGNAGMRTERPRDFGVPRPFGVLAWSRKGFHAEHAERAEERHAENDLPSEISNQRRAPLGGKRRKDLRSASRRGIAMASPEPQRSGALISPRDPKILLPDIGEECCSGRDLSR